MKPFIGNISDMVHKGILEEAESGCDQTIAEIGQALGHPTRIQIIRLLVNEELCGCEIAPFFALDQSGISRHLNALRRAGLVISRRAGVRIYWRLSSPNVARLLHLLEEISQKGKGS